MELGIGEKLTVTICDLAFGGAGVARIEDFVIFVPFVIPGEQVEVEILEVKKRFARGRLVKLLQAGPQRIAPLCRYYGECGGCQYQHLAYPAQLALKHKQVVDIFERIGHFHAPLVLPVTPCPEPFGYRNRILIRSQWNKPKQCLNLGFLRAHDRLVVDVEACPIAAPGLNAELLRVRANPPPKGGLKVLLRLPIPGWEVPRDSFFQNNSLLLPELVRLVSGCLKESGIRFLVDAYCGVGFFSLELAGQVEGFIGVEYDRPAVRAAQKNAVQRKVTQGEFWEGKTEELLPAILRRFPAGATVVLVDPPRAGCRPESLAQLREVRPAQIIYVSCNPSTQARDLNILCQDDVYRLMKIIPVDMFPQTQHVECIADLRLSKP